MALVLQSEVILLMRPGQASRQLREGERTGDLEPAIDTIHWQSALCFRSEDRRRGKRKRERRKRGLV